MQNISGKRMGQNRKTSVTLVIIVVAIFTMGMEDPRKLNDEIQKHLRQTVEINRQPKPHVLNRRAARMQRNRYHYNYPVGPKTIYREQVFPPQPGSHRRWYGGVPRG